MLILELVVRILSVTELPVEFNLLVEHFQKLLHFLLPTSLRVIFLVVELVVDFELHDGYVLALLLHPG